MNAGFRRKRGYYATPNTDIPLNNRQKGEIADIAYQQLRKFQEAAETWPIHPVLRDGRASNICRVCDQNLWFKYDEYKAELLYSEAEIKALIVAHIRQRHTDDNGVIDEVSGECEILDVPHRTNAGGRWHGPTSGSINQDSNPRGIEQAPPSNPSA